MMRCKSSQEFGCKPLVLGLVNSGFIVDCMNRGVWIEGLSHSISLETIYGQLADWVSVYNCVFKLIDCKPFSFLHVICLETNFTENWIIDGYVLSVQSLEGVFVWQRLLFPKNA